MHKFTPKKLILATHNKGKLREIAELFAPYQIDVTSAGDLGLSVPEETGTTFAENALIKAHAAAKASGLPALSDDSGLCVDALDGAPGVYSADWSEPGRDFAKAMRRVYEELLAKDIILDRHCEPRIKSGAKQSSYSGSPRRPDSLLAMTTSAHFTCVLALALPDGAAHVFEGQVQGALVWPPRGDQGFGYDPMFVPDGYDITFGEMESAAKHAISHRAKAFEKLAYYFACNDPV